MKNLFLSFLVSTSLIACTNQNAETDKQVIGYNMSKDGNRAPIYGGDISAVKIMENWIKAHNERDLATIRSLEASENFEIISPDGRIDEGVDSQLKYLATWFTNNNPKVTIRFLIASNFTNKSGKLQQWVTSGGELIETIDGKEVKNMDYYDALIINGKIQKMLIGRRKIVAGE